MDFRVGNIYHIYNRGNDRQQIFFTHHNYLYFLRKVRKYMLPHCEILAYVLMPNHFHFLVYADERTEKDYEHGAILQNVLSNGIRLLLSSYTKGVNKQEGRTGNLIQQNTKAKCVFDSENPSTKNYSEICFDYIHDNPVRSGLVLHKADWVYSSYQDYLGVRKGTLCNLKLFPELFNDSQSSIHNEEELKRIFY